MLQGMCQARKLGQTGIQEVVGSILRLGNIVSWKLIMKSFAVHTHGTRVSGKEEEISPTGRLEGSLTAQLKWAASSEFVSSSILS